MSKQVRVTSRAVKIKNETAMLEYYKWNLSDLLIYQYFKLKLQQKIETNQTYYKAEVQKLKLRRNEIYNSCVERNITANQTTSSGSKIAHYDYKLKSSAASTCQHFTSGIRNIWKSLSNQQ